MPCTARASAITAARSSLTEPARHNPAADASRVAASHDAHPSSTTIYFCQSVPRHNSPSEPPRSRRTAHQQRRAEQRRRNEGGRRADVVPGRPGGEVVNPKHPASAVFGASFARVSSRRSSSADAAASPTEAAEELMPVAEQIEETMLRFVSSAETLERELAGRVRGPTGRAPPGAPGRGGEGAEKYAAVTTPGRCPR